MSAGYLASLGVAVTALFAGRFLFRGLALPRQAVSLSLSEMVMAGVGVAALAFHCAAMFFPGAVSLLPGSDGVSNDIRELGVRSMIWYAAPAIAVLASLRRAHRGALAAALVALSLVGITMYDGGPLSYHLLAIWMGTITLAAVFATFVRPPPVRALART